MLRRRAGARRYDPGVPARRLPLALGAALAAVGLAVAVTSSASARTAPRTTPSTKVVPCLGAPQVRPASYVIACGDGNWFVTSIHWVRWSASVAIGRATVHLNDCTPYCAAGTFHTTPGVVVLSDPVTSARYGTLYSVISVLDASRLPGSNSATTIVDLPLTPRSG